MASIIKASIDVNKIPKDKIFVGKKGKYLPSTNVEPAPRDGAPAAPQLKPQEEDLPF